MAYDDYNDEQDDFVQDIAFGASVGAAFGNAKAGITQAAVRSILKQDDNGQDDFAQDIAFGASVGSTFGNVTAGIIPAALKSILKEKGGYIKPNIREGLDATDRRILKTTAITLSACIGVSTALIGGLLYFTNPVEKQIQEPQVSYEQTIDESEYSQPDLSFTFDDDTLNPQVSDSQTKPTTSENIYTPTESSTSTENDKTTLDTINNSMVDAKIKIESTLTNDLDQGQ